MNEIQDKRSRSSFCGPHRWVLHLGIASRWPNRDGGSEPLNRPTRLELNDILYNFFLQHSPLMSPEKPKIWNFHQGNNSLRDKQYFTGFDVSVLYVIRCKRTFTDERINSLNFESKDYNSRLFSLNPLFPLSTNIYAEETKRKSKRISQDPKIINFIESAANLAKK